MINFYKSIILILIFVIPFFPVQLDTRINYFIYVLALILVPFFYLQVKKDLQEKNLVTFFFVLFLISSLISAVFSYNTYISLQTFYLYLSYFVVFISFKKLFKGYSEKNILTGTLIIVSAVLSAVSFYNTVFLNYINRDSIGASFMWLYYGHNHLANLLLYAVPLSGYFLYLGWKHKFKRFIYLFLTAFFSISLYLTFSRGAYLSFIFSLVISMLIFKDFFKNHIKITLVIFLSLLMASFFYLHQGAAFFNLTKSQNLISLRDIYWQEAINNFLKKPFTGTGLNTYKLVSFPKKPKGVLKADYAHNFFLQMLSDGGVLLFLSGLGLVLSLIISIFKKLKALPKKNYFLVALWVGLISSILYNMVDYGWQLPFSFLIFWIASAILIQKDDKF